MGRTTSKKMIPLLLLKILLRKFRFIQSLFIIFKIYFKISLPTFSPVHLYMFNRCALEFTSHTNGPFFDCKISTPQKSQPVAFVAFRARFFSASVGSYFSIVPPLDMFARKSPVKDFLFIHATTLSPTMLILMSSPQHSEIYS